MNVIKTKDYEALSEVVSDILIGQLLLKPDTNICVASGDSPKKSYQLFVEKCVEKKVNTSQLMITKLDEWCGVSSDSDMSCEKDIVDHIVNPLAICNDNYISFKPDATDYQLEVENVERQLQKNNLDICVLGLGRNGHLGLIEPNMTLNTKCFVSTLDELTKHHPMIDGKVNVDYGMSLGLGNLFKAKNILLLITGDGKEAVIKDFFGGKISTQNPSSLLWLHDNLTIIIEDKYYPYE